MSRSGKANLQGRVVAVTGGARGIGLGIARACADAGMRVAIGDLTPEAREAGVARIAGDPLALPLNVTSRESFSAFLDEVESGLGPLDVLVNNAGVFKAGDFADEDDEVTDRMVDVNVRGPLTGSKLALQRMIPRNRGHIVNLASIGSVVPTAGSVTYSTTKAAVLGMCRALRWELCDTDIRVTAILPGVIKTDMSEHLPPPSKLSPKPVEPYVVGEKVVKALRTGALEVFVPGSLTPVNRMIGLLGPCSADVLKKGTGLHKLVAKRDLDAERHYQDRVKSEHERAK